MSDCAEWLEPLVASGTAEKVISGVFKYVASVQGVEKLKHMYVESGLNFKQVFLAEKNRDDTKYWETFLQNRGSSFAGIFS